MRSYIIDEISLPDMERIEKFLKENSEGSGIEKVFWVKIPDDYLNDIQSRHRECQPHVFAIELGADWIKAEFLIRTLKDLRCQCNCYCDPKQRGFIIDSMEAMIEELDIRP